VIDVQHQQRQRFAVLDGELDRRIEGAVEVFAVAEAGERVGEAFGPDGFEVLLELADLLL
jgi:hypothetical protein